MDFAEPMDISGVTSAVIRIAGIAATLDPPVNQVAQALTAPGLQFTTGGPLGFAWGYQPTQFYGTDSLGRLIFRAGLVPRVADLLRRHGVQVHIRDQRRFSDVHRPDPTVLADDVQYADLLLTLQRHPLGQIVPLRLADVPEILAAICRGYAKAKILLAVATKRQVKFLWRFLREKVPGTTVQLVTGGTRDRANRLGRVTVCTYARVQALSWEPVDILIYPQPNGNLPECAADIRGPVNRPLRIYAVGGGTACGRESEALHMEAMTGPLIYDGRPALVDGTVVLVEGGSPAGQRKLDLWLNPTRNRAIAAICKAMATGDAGAMVRQGIPLTVARQVVQGRRRVTVVVESPHHGFLLQQLLPNWTNQGGAFGDYGDETVDADAPGRIVTELFLAHHRPDTDVLIRASGEGLLGEIGFSPLTRRPAAGLLVVDFIYGAPHHTQRRIGEYKGFGWTVIKTTLHIPSTAVSQGGGLEDP